MHSMPAREIFFEIIQHTLAYFIRSVIFRHFLSHQEHPLITAHFFLHGFS